MANRADYSVKPRRRDQASPINGYALGAGSILASIGALAAIIAGGELGKLVGACAFTILIFVQIFLLRRLTVLGNKVQKLTGEQKQQPTDIMSETGALILIIGVTSLGRVREIWGNRALLPTLKEGALIETVLPSEQKPVEVQANGEAMSLSLATLPAVDGRLLVLLPEALLGGSLRQQLEDRTNFFAGLGHDLKSPLNAVIGFADIMDAEIRGPMPDAYRDYPGLIRESGETLLRLVEDMLGYARSEAGTYELDPMPMDIASSGESVMRQSQAAADKAGVSLRLDTHQEVLALADAGAIHRIWDNLVSNAIKYSAAEGEVLLSAYMKGDKAVLRVRDRGAGMDAEDLARIARPFEQGRNARGRAGTGLGLAMVQRLAEMQGGQVMIETAPGAGTTVTVSLPAASEVRKKAAE